MENLSSTSPLMPTFIRETLYVPNLNKIVFAGSVFRLGTKVNSSQIGFLMIAEENPSSLANCYSTTVTSSTITATIEADATA